MKTFSEIQSTAYGGTILSSSLALILHTQGQVVVSKLSMCTAMWLKLARLLLLALPFSFFFRSLYLPTVYMLMN